MYLILRESAMHTEVVCKVRSHVKWLLLFRVVAGVQLCIGVTTQSKITYEVAAIVVGLLPTWNRVLV